MNNIADAFKQMTVQPSFPNVKKCKVSFLITCFDYGRAMQALNIKKKLLPCADHQTLSKDLGREIYWDYEEGIKIKQPISGPTHAYHLLSAYRNQLRGVRHSIDVVYEEVGRTLGGYLMLDEFNETVLSEAFKHGVIKKGQLWYTFK
jgi:hypothetical protein